MLPAEPAEHDCCPTTMPMARNSGIAANCTPTRSDASVPGAAAPCLRPASGVASSACLGLLSARRIPFWTTDPTPKEPIPMSSTEDRLKQLIDEHPDLGRDPDFCHSQSHSGVVVRPCVDGVCILGAHGESRAATPSSEHLRSERLDEVWEYNRYSCLYAVPRRRRWRCVGCDFVDQSALALPPEMPPSRRGTALRVNRREWGATIA